MTAPGLTVRELAELLGLPLDYVRRLVDRGTIHSINFGPGTKRFIPEAELHELRALGFDVPDVRDVRRVQDSQSRQGADTVDA